MATILLAEEEPSTRQLVRDMLRGRGFEVVSVRDGTEALAKLGEREFDLVLSDVAMPGADGCEVLRRSKQLAPDTEVVMATRDQTGCDWIGAGAFGSRGAASCFTGRGAGLAAAFLSSCLFTRCR